MARPSRLAVPTKQGWNADVDANFIAFFDAPLPAFRHNNTAADLETNYPAAQYTECVCWAWKGSAAGSGFAPYISVSGAGGTYKWHLMASWFNNRKTIIVDPGTSYAVLDADDMLIKENSTAQSANLPAISDGNRGRILRFGNKTGTSSALTINPNGSDTIGGGSSLIVNPAETYEIASPNSGSDWLVVHRP